MKTNPRSEPLLFARVIIEQAAVLSHEGLLPIIGQADCGLPLRRRIAEIYRLELGGLRGRRGQQEKRDSSESNLGQGARGRVNGSFHITYECRGTVVTRGKATGQLWSWAGADANSSAPEARRSVGVSFACPQASLRDATGDRESPVDLGPRLPSVIATRFRKE